MKKTKKPAMKTKAKTPAKAVKKLVKKVSVRKSAEQDDMSTGRKIDGEWAAAPGADALARMERIAQGLCWLPGSRSGASLDSIGAAMTVAGS